MPYIYWESSTGVVGRGEDMSLENVQAWYGYACKKHPAFRHWIKYD